MPCGRCYKPTLCELDLTSKLKMLIQPFNSFVYSGGHIQKIVGGRGLRPRFPVDGILCAERNFSLYFLIN